jgi:hypothetical protein
MNGKGQSAEERRTGRVHRGHVNGMAETLLKKAYLAECLDRTSVSAIDRGNDMKKTHKDLGLLPVFPDPIRANRVVVVIDLTRF